MRATVVMYGESTQNNLYRVYLPVQPEAVGERAGKRPGRVLTVEHQPVPSGNNAVPLATDTRLLLTPCATAKLNRVL